METLLHFSSLEELIRALEREQKLLGALFQNRKKSSFRYELARELARRRDESMDFLRRYGVIRTDSDFVELEDVYLRFFEEVLEVNEQISVASVKESIDNLNTAIDYYLSENNPSRKHGYLNDVKRILRTISLTTLRNVIDLKRNIDNTYKNEPNFTIKKKKLVHLDRKRKDIAEMIDRCENVIDEGQIRFFTEAMDVQLRDIVVDVKLRFREVYHNLLELDRQIINYLNMIDYQSRILQKVQKLKYLRDQMLLETDTDIRSRFHSVNPVWMEPRPRYTLKVSLSMLRNSDEGLRILRDAVHGKGSDRLRKGNLAEPLTAEDMQIQQKVLQFVDISEVKNAFMASGDDLYHFIDNYSGYRKTMNREDRLVLFCQIAAQYFEELVVTQEYCIDDGIEYPMIYPKTA